MNDRSICEVFADCTIQNVPFKASMKMVFLAAEKDVVIILFSH